MVLSAVQVIRHEAIRTTSVNRLRQISIATHHYVSVNNGRIPAYPAPTTFQNPLPPGEGVLPMIRPFLDSNISFIKNPQANNNYVLAFLSPADPTWTDSTYGDVTREGNCSYVVNFQVFQAGSKYPDTYTDSTTATIALGERYARCKKTGTDWGLSRQVCRAGIEDDAPYISCSFTNSHRPTFADPNYDDVMPVTVNGVTLPSAPGVTFQVRPSKDACDYRQLQTPHPGGMLTAYLDGSVRTTSPRVSPAVFWAAVTPAGGEVAPPE
jgi:hypothetical protein